MSECLLSVGIDIGTSTTQLVISRLTVENRAGAFAVPRIAITEREVCYRSGIHLTPLLSDTVIDAEGIRKIVAAEFEKSGYRRNQMGTGAVIITGETARKENSRDVLNALSEFAGDFVVATAGPDLEAILAARGAGADEYSRENQCSVLHFDIGGGTSNLAFYENGVLNATGCLDIGGRLIRFDRKSRMMEYVAPVLQRLMGNGPEPGTVCTPETLRSVLEPMTEALEQAAGLRPGKELMEQFMTDGTRWDPVRADVLSFSGGVADGIYEPGADWKKYGDIGVLLGQMIHDSRNFRSAKIHRGAETIRATVVGAGSHSTNLSGSTIYYRDVGFPLKNLPVLKLSEQDEQGDAAQMENAIRAKLRWFADESGLTQVALLLRGTDAPPFSQIKTIADGVCNGLRPLLDAGFFPVVIVERDMGKVLGQAMAARLTGPLLCLDGISMENGDYLDIGEPVAGQSVLPVVIKTLVFNK